MGGKSSKDTQGVGLVPRDGTDEIDVHPKKMVTQEQFDELLHKFSLLEQLMQQDKSKISDLESSVTQYQLDKQQLRQSFVEIDSEVRRDKDERERLENNLAERVEQQTRAKYLLLDQMLTSQSQRIEQLIKDQEANSNNIRAEYGQLDRKLTSSLQVDRNEVEKLVASKLTEETVSKGAFEKRVSQMIDENSLSVSIVREQLEDRKREAEEVRDSVQREKQALLEEIARVQGVMQDAKQTDASEKRLAEQLSATKEQLEERLSEEERARAQLGSLMKAMLENKVSENQKAFLEQIKAQESVIQDQMQRMEELRGTMDNSVKAEQARVREEVDKRISDMTVSYSEQLALKETEKKDMTRKLSQDFESRLQEMQSSLNKDIQVHRSKAETILESSDEEKKNLQERIDAMEGGLLQKIEDADRESQLAVDDKLTILRQELGSHLSRGQQAESEVASLAQQLTAVRGELSVVRDSQTGIKDDVELMQSKLSSDMDVKMQLMIQARVAEVSSELSEKYIRSEENFSQLAEKVDSLGTSSDPSQDPLHLEYVQKTSEDTAILLDRMDETGAQLQSLSEHVVELERRLELSQKEVQQNQGQLQTAQGDLLMVRSENSELTQKCETQAAELAHVLAENSKLKQSVDSAMQAQEEQSKDIEQLKSQIGLNSSVSEIPPQSPLEKIEDMESVIKKQGHGINDLEFLFDQAKEMSKSSAENVENAIIKFDTKLEDETAKLRTDLENLKTELTKKISEISALVNPEQP